MIGLLQWTPLIATAGIGIGSILLAYFFAL